MPTQPDSILKLVLNSYVSNDRFFISSQQGLKDFWSEVKEFKFKLTRPVHTEERTLDPAKVKTNCLEWLAGEEDLLQISLRAKDIQNDTITVEMMWVIIHRIGKNQQKALRAGPVANLHIERGKQHFAS